MITATWLYVPSRGTNYWVTFRDRPKPGFGSICCFCGQDLLRSTPLYYSDAHLVSFFWFSRVKPWTNARILQLLEIYFLKPSCLWMNLKDVVASSSERDWRIVNWCLLIKQNERGLWQRAELRFFTPFVFYKYESTRMKLFIRSTNFKALTSFSKLFAIYIDMF